MGRKVLFYNPAVLVVAEGAVSAQATIDDIRATAKALSPCIIIDASRFEGNLERHQDELPESVHLLGEDSLIADEGGPTVFGAIRQAFEAAGVPVEETSVLESEASRPNSSSEDDEELAGLKARATELGIHFAPNIGRATLAGRILAKEKELEEAAS